MGNDKAPPDTHVDPPPPVVDKPPTDEIPRPPRLRNFRRINTWGPPLQNYVN
jgi:hypothetical protein